MGIQAIEFIESKREILNEKDQLFWGDEFLFFTLQMAYTSLQKDVPYFKHIEKIQTTKGRYEYLPSKKILQPIRMKIEAKEYAIVSDKKFFDLFEEEDRICTSYEHKLLVSYPPQADGMQIDVRYFYLHELLNENCEIKLPEHYMEALHFNFLAKVWEKNPKRESTILKNTYRRDYEMEKIKLESYGKVKGRKLKSQFKKV